MSCRGNFIEAKTTQNDKFTILCWIFTLKTITLWEFFIGFFCLKLLIKQYKTINLLSETINLLSETINLLYEMINFDSKR